MSSNDRVFRMKFSAVYPLYVQKVERKGRTKEELDTVLGWLVNLPPAQLRKAIDEELTFSEFFERFPLNENTRLITGVVCGIRVENIADPLMQKIRYMDKVVDELAKGKAVDKILRK